MRRVLLLGDSITFGLFGTSPLVDKPLSTMLADRGVALHVTGYPAENPSFEWPDHLPWALRMRHEVDTWNPDMVIIQSMLFHDYAEPGRVDAYRAAIAELMDIAKSRGAHVYIVAHRSTRGAPEEAGRRVAERLQAEAAKSRGISTIPLDWWLARCQDPTIGDGIHLTSSGQKCNALAITMAVDQLRGVVG